MMEVLGEGLWRLPYWARSLRNAVIFPAKTWVIRLETGGVALISPGATCIEACNEIEAIGPVEILIAPNCFHHLYLAEAQAAFPAAKTWLAPGLARKRPDLRCDASITSYCQFDSALQHRFIKGAPKLGETIFLHRPSKTLLITDLLFNIQEVDTGWAMPLLLRLAGTYKTLGCSRLVKWLVSDKEEVADSLTVVLSWDFTQVDPNHGDLITGDVKQRLREAWSEFPILG